jgi:NADH-quinone oxidoreductase subunit E
MVWEAENKMEAAPTAEKSLDKQLKAEITKLFDSYPSRRAALLPSLHKVQNKLGFLPDETLVEVAELLEISPAEVLDTATFYDMYTREKRGRHLIGVCESLSCELCGCEEILKAIKDKLGIEPGQTTEDEKFTLITMQCIGACDFAPAVLIDDKLYKTVTVEQLDKILDRNRMG